MFGRHKVVAPRAPVKFHVAWRRGGATFYVDAVTGEPSCWTYDKGTRPGAETEEMIEHAMAELELALGREPRDAGYLRDAGQPGITRDDVGSFEWTPALPPVIGTG